MFDKHAIEALGEEQPDEPGAKKQLRLSFTQLPEGQSFGQAYEGLDMIKSAAQAQKVTSLGDILFIVLVAEETTINVPEDIIPFGQIWLSSSEELSKLSSRGRMEVVPGVEHMGILYSDAVTKAIQEVVEAARQAP
jgi:hypothetical protein